MDFTTELPFPVVVALSTRAQQDSQPRSFFPGTSLSKLSIFLDGQIIATGDNFGFIVLVFWFHNGYCWLERGTNFAIGC